MNILFLYLNKYIIISYLISRVLWRNEWKEEILIMFTNL